MATITYSKLDSLPAGTIDTVIQHLSLAEPALGFGVNRHRLEATEDPASIEICPIAIMDAVEERVALKKKAGMADIEPLAMQIASRYRLTGSDCLPGVPGAALEVVLFYQGRLAEGDALRLLNFPALQIAVRQNKHLTKVNLILVPDRLKGKDDRGNEQ